MKPLALSFVLSVERGTYLLGVSRINFCTTCVYCCSSGSQQDSLPYSLCIVLVVGHRFLIGGTVSGKAGSSSGL